LDLIIEEDYSLNRLNELGKTHIPTNNIGIRDFLVGSPKSLG
jgi:hypothetical protein